MFCFKCGSKQADTAKFCGVCGTKMASVVSSPESVAPTSPPVVPAAPPSVAPRTPPVVAIAQPASLTVEQWEVTGYPPDSDGDSRFEAKAVIVYEGEAPASLARLRWIAYDPTGQFPLVQAESDVTRDIDDGDDIELEASSYGKLGPDVTADACRVEAQVLVFPGERATVLSTPLPEAGVVGGRPEGACVGAATLVAWKVASAESPEESASYSVMLVIRNDGPALLAAVTVRLRVLSRKGDAWTNDYVTVEQLAPGELRVLDTSVWLSERARVRKGATLQVSAIACARPAIVALPSVVPAAAAPAETAEESEPDGDVASVSDGYDVTYHFTVCILTADVADVLALAGNEDCEPFPRGEEIDLLYDYPAERVVGARSSQGVLFGAECTPERLAGLITATCPLAIQAGLSPDEILFMGSPPNSKAPRNFPDESGYRSLLEWGGDARNLSGEDVERFRRLQPRARGVVWVTQRSRQDVGLHTESDLEEAIDLGMNVVATNDYCFLFR